MSSNFYPLSLDLKNQPVLVVGAGKIAARKIPELLQCGAKITVISPEHSEALQHLASALDIRPKAYVSGDENGYYLVFACTDSEALNESIALSCLGKKILCNTAHSAEKSSFHVPGVIRKGEVTVAISSGGAAPGLTRYLKSKLSAYLGDSLAGLTLLLKILRQKVRQDYSPAQAIAWLESLPYALVYSLADEKGLTEAEAWLENWLEEKKHPKVIPKRIIHPVILAGAGPGHPKLLTLMALEAIQNAEIILHDRLIPLEILQKAAPTCRLIPVEKRGHQESMRQEHINTLLLEYAQKGFKVLRLKGGDPFIFGRGYEEIQALETANIAWQIIPGLSSALAAPALAGLPLTHRGMARSFAVMSGMAYAQTNVDIPKADTIVLLMGYQRLQEIIPAFIEKGWSPETPVAAIQNGTRPEQRLCISTLKDIAFETAKLGFDSPVLLVIGEAAALAKTQITKS